MGRIVPLKTRQYRVSTPKTQKVIIQKNNKQYTKNVNIT
jgi:hypothetical protein